MIVLGLNLIHDTSAALIKDGVIIGAVEEERFNRVRHTTAFPSQSIKWLLQAANVNIGEIDFVATSFDFEKFLDNSSPFEQNTILHDDIRSSGLRQIQTDNHALWGHVRRQMDMAGIKEWRGIPHHFSHAAGGYFLSGFEEANVLVIDGRGENHATSMIHAKNGEFTILDQYTIHDSIGHLY